MKTLKLIFFGALFFPIMIFAQVDTSITELPALPKIDFNLGFQNFPGMSLKEEKALLKPLNKDLRKQLKTIKKFNKRKYFNFLRESQFKNIRFPFITKREKLMRQREKKIFELEIKSEALAAKFENANKSEKVLIKKELKKILERLFDQKEENRKQEVEELQQELEELKKSLKIRLENKNQIINKRMQELLNEDKYLDWD